MLKEIFKDIALGKMPNRETLVNLIASNPEEYTQALAAKALLDISTIQDEMDMAIDKEEIDVLKIKIKHLTFMAERLLPTVFGTKIEVTHQEKTKPAESEMQKIVDQALHKTLHELPEVHESGGN